MKCYDFETNITELLNGKLEESKRREALAHAISCKKCEDVLCEQQRLNLELQTFAAEQSFEQLSPEVELRLASIFRAQATGLTTSRPKRSVPSLFVTLRSFKLQNKRLYATIMAGLVLGGLGLYSLFHRPTGIPVKNASTHQIKITGPVELKYETKASQVPITAGNRSAAIVPEQVPVIRRTRSQSRRSDVSDRVEWITAEVATDFYTIPYVQPFGPNDRVRVVRTQAPHSMLADFGFPVYSDQAFYPVQADVMVGDDNMVRAIRFVQQWRLPRNASRLSAHETKN
jgi:hypothetical protein